MNRSKQFLFMSLLFVVFLNILNIPLISESYNNDIEEQLNQIEQAGTYPINVSYQDEFGNTVSKEIYVTVLRPKTFINSEVREGIDGQDVEINSGYFEKLSNEDLQILASIYAWNLDTGAEIPITEITRDVKDKKAGIYNVTFKTAKGTSFTSTILEKNYLLPYETKEDYYYLTYEFRQQFLLTTLFSLLLIAFMIVFYSVLQTTKKATLIYTALYKKQAKLLSQKKN